MNTRSVSVKSIQYFTCLILLSLLSIIILFLSGCTKEGPAGPPGSDNLTNPTIDPVVLFTHPGNNSVGPFNLFDKHHNYNLPHFAVRFNKLMNKQSFQTKLVKVQGFDKPVVVDLEREYVYREGFQKSSASYDDVLAFAVYDSNSYSTKSVFEVGKSYTVTLEAGIEDINGNTLAMPFQFSFIPEPYFRVLRIDPENGSANVLPGERIYIYFNSPVDAGVFPSLQIAPAIQGDWRITPYDSSVVYYQRWNDLPFDSAFTVTVGSTAKDKHGNQINKLYSSSFSVPSFGVYIVYPLNGSTNVNLLSSIGAWFNGVIDTSSVRRALSITPTLPGTLQMYYDDEFYFLSTNGFDPETHYTVTISTGMKSIDGIPIKSPYQFSFMSAPFRGEYTFPNDGQTSVPLTYNINVYFNGRIDTATIRQAFSINPPVSGMFEFYDPTSSFIFNPAADFLRNTTYTVTISTTLKTRGGFNLKEPYVFRFRTVQ